MEIQSFGKILINVALATMVLTFGSPVLGQIGEPSQDKQARIKNATPDPDPSAAVQAPVEPQDQVENESQVPSAVEPKVQITEIKTVAAPTQKEENEEPRVASNVSGLKPEPKASVAAPHPLDRAIEMATNSLTKMRTDVKDYSGLFYRRECYDGTKGDPSYMQLKIRCPRPSQSERVPFSIYMKFLKPRQSAGRECIWVDGANNSKIVAHEARGLIGLRRFYLEPTGMIAMRESRYPIYEAGIENLIKKLIQKAERDRAAGPCVANYKDNCEVNGRKCSMIEVCHAEQKEPYEFHIARVFMDHETQLPIAYAAYDWPTTPGGKPRLLEEYHYLNLKINVGLTEHDFSADNSSYGYPKR